ncbi:menin-like isoform X2 [Tigriopus californicus]|uniref:menin-like isoform X2 n=1 Tax=Tigriopus californicus TaxID=6832 RepID=UPI0027DA82C2|nr:menin-like isoform X2 [Tigriopus californicus]
MNRQGARDGFPLRTVGQVRQWVEAQLATPEPDLALLSIVVGQLEHQWTAGKVGSGPAAESTVGLGGAGAASGLTIEPPLTWPLIEASVAKFESIIRSYCDSLVLSAALSAPENVSAIRALIKHVADIIWNTLSKSHYKDRPHLQSIYSYLTGNKLDCFGVAFAVVASCQLLEVPHVHLALSEDHAWVVFGAEGTETAEVTWHGKGNEDKRGQPVDIHKAKTSWLYLAGQPVVCDRHMEVAALVSSINPAVSANVDSVECGVLQQELLWLLYDHGHLSKYPMALGNLADLEEIESSLGRPSCQQIFDQAIRVNRDVYANHHVYPYTYQAGYHYRLKQYKAALKSWANAAEVIKRYCYSKDDEEIYKEFLEIANELIPHTVKAASLNPQAYSEVLQDPECFASILQFYDGICCWEEGSPTPVLHIGWAKPMVSTCSKFEAEVRARVEIPKEASEDKEDEEEEEEAEDPTTASTTSAKKAEKNPPPLKKVYLELHSAKMRGLKDLLCAEKLNTSAIQLQLTAQSQTDVKRPPWTTNIDDAAFGGRPKRTRRE